MDAALPPALRAALDRDLTGASRRDLAARVAATTRTYRAGGGSAAVIRDADDALAYALTRMPATYAACAAAFDAAARRAPDFSPRRLLDAGCGPGTASWAAVETWDSLEQVDWLDASAPFLTLAARLAADGPDALAAARSTRADLLAVEPAPADLVVASYAFAELNAEAQTRLARRLWAACEGLLVVVEPGTPDGHRRILALRDVLIGEGATIAAPCTHADACPVADPDWCHFSVRLPRSRDHRLAKGADVPYEDEKFAYLVAARPGVATGPAAARVLARPRAGKPGIQLKLCTPTGLEDRFVARRDKSDYAVARRLDWGDGL